MTKQYTELLIAAVQYCEVAAERAMEDERRKDSAEAMRNSYQAIREKLRDGAQMDESEWGQVLVAVTVFIETTKTKLEGIIKIYEEDIANKVSEVVKHPENADQIFC